MWQKIKYPWFGLRETMVWVADDPAPPPPPAPKAVKLVTEDKPVGNLLDARNPWAQAILATIITLGFFVAMFVPGVWNGFVVDEALKQTLQNLFILVIGYYFGSSSSSAKKDEVIATQAATANSTGGSGGEVKIDDSTPVRTTEVKS